MNRNVLTIFCLTLIGIEGVAILSPAFPEIQSGLGITKYQVALLVTAFTLPGMLLAPLIGILADRLGRKKVIVPCLFLFGLSGSACAFADFKAMLVLRFLQGIGGSALTSLAVTLIGDLYTGLERAKMLGYNAGVLSLGLAFYPILGGFLADISWRLIFLIFASAIPVGLVAMGLKVNGVYEEPFSGYIEESLRLFRKRRLLIAMLSGCTVFVITYGSITIYLSYLLEDRFGLTPDKRGLIIAFVFIFVALVASNLKLFVSELGERWTITVGFVSYAIALSIIPFTYSLAILVFALLLYGFGHGTVLPTLQNLVVSIAPPENRGIATTTYGSMVRLGQTIGPIFGSLLVVHSLNLVFLASAMLATFFAFINAFG